MQEDLRTMQSAGRTSDTVEIVVLEGAAARRARAVAVPATLAALQARSGVVLVAARRGGCVVTLDHGRTLTLWDPRAGRGEPAREAFTGSLAAAVVRAMVWLGGHLGVDPVDGVAPRIDAFAFPRGLLA